MHDFIKKIQEGSNDSKRLWLFLFSGTAMLVVVFVWFKYFNFLVAPLGAPQPTDNEAGQGFTFWQTFRAGLAVIFRNVAETAQHLLGIIGGPRSYIIRP